MDDFSKRSISPGWARKLREAQEETDVVLKGDKHDRIPYGKELAEIGQAPEQCWDCCCKVDEYHVLGCDNETCPRCGGALSRCGCKRSANAPFMPMLGTVGCMGPDMGLAASTAMMLGAGRPVAFHSIEDPELVKGLSDIHIASDPYSMRKAEEANRLKELTDQVLDEAFVLHPVESPNMSDKHVTFDANVGSKNTGECSGLEDAKCQQCGDKNAQFRCSEEELWCSTCWFTCLEKTVRRQKRTGTLPGPKYWQKGSAYYQRLNKAKLETTAPVYLSDNIPVPKPKPVKQKDKKHGKRNPKKRS